MRDTSIVKLLMLIINYYCSEEAKAFSNGLAAVKQEGKWGYIANPLIYKEWISDELLRGQSLGLFTAKNGTSATMNALLPMLSNLIEKIDGSKLNSDELLSALKLNENLEVDNNTPLTRQDACVALASVAEYLGENVY